MTDVAEDAEVPDMLDDVKKLTAAGVKQQQAEAIIKIVERKMAKVVSSDYLDQVIDRAFERFETKMAQQFSTVHASIKTLDAKLDNVQLKLEKDLLDVELRLTKKAISVLFGVGIALVSIGLTIAKFLF